MGLHKRRGSSRHPSACSKRRWPRRHKVGTMKICGLTLPLLLSLSYNNAIACNDAFDSQTYPSPSGDTDARLIRRFCPTDDENNKTYYVVVNSHNIAKTVYQTWNDAPEVAWRSAKDLVITVTALTNIATSEHSFDDIVISYRVELPDSYLRVLAKAKQAISSDKKSFDPNMVSYLGIIDAFIAFKKWADANAEYENFR